MVETGRRDKTQRRTEEDDDETSSTSATTIPYLPDNVIQRIFSFLSVEDTTRATAISKQWSSHWPCFSVIDLDEGDPTNCLNHQRFINFLRYSLRRCRDQRRLDKLRVRICLDMYAFVLVREWIVFAIERFVKELHLLNLGENSCYMIGHDVLTSQCLTSLNLENVRLYASNGINGNVSLPLLKTISLTEVTFMDDRKDRANWAIPSLISGCPSIERLSITKCKLGKSGMELDISSDSLKSLEIMHCHSGTVVVTAKNLESFKFYSDCTCRFHEALYLRECDSLKHVHISCKGLKQLLLHNCFETMENLFHAPNLEVVEFSGYLKTKVHFVEAPANLVEATIRVWEKLWPIEYYSAMRDFLESFDCSRQVKIHIYDAEAVIIPEHCRIEWSPPLPSIKQLQLYFSAPLADKEYCLRRSLLWMAPSAEILPFIHNDDD